MKYSIFTILFSSKNGKCDVVLTQHAHGFRIWQKMGNGSVLIVTECLHTRSSGFINLSVPSRTVSYSAMCGIQLELESTIYLYVIFDDKTKK